MDFNQVIVVVAFLVSAFNLWDKIDSRIKQAKEPTKLLDERIKTLETLVTTEYAQKFVAYDAHFNRDLKRIEAIEEGNKITQRALLALLNHAVDGNDVAEIQKVSKDLTNYLINR